MTTTVEETLQWIDKQLLTAAIEYGDTTVGWISLEDPTGGPLTLTSRRSLYRGQLGIALYLAYRGEQSGRRELVTLAKQAIEPWLTCDVAELDLEYTGGTNGVGGLVYGFTQLYEATGDPQYADRADEILRQTPRSFVQKDTANDVIYGNAGLILASLAHDQRRRSPVAIDRAQVAADTLLSERVTQGETAAWKTTAGSCAVGFAHGASGIGLAFARLAARTDRPQYEEVAEAAMAFERRQFVEADGIWAIPPEQAIRDVDTGWCWGPAGVALSRVGYASTIGSNSLLEETLASAVGRIDVGLNEWDSLCHGTASTISVLTTVGRRTQFDCFDSAQTVADAIIARRAEEGRFRFPGTRHTTVAQPSLFRGYAGVGYALLRLVEPEIPDVLLLE